jgi:hypothetical protein
MTRTNDAMNRMIRQAAGRLPVAPPTTGGQGALDQGALAAWIWGVKPEPKPNVGSADGGAGQGQEPRPGPNEIVNRALREAAGGRSAS